jgi:hypothetical protein
MLMVYPVNITSAYIGFPILLWLALDLFHRIRKNQSSSLSYIAYACFLASICLLFTFLPYFFTTDTKIINYFTYVADVFIISCFLLLWLFCIHAFLSTKPRLTVIATIAVFALAIASYYSAMILSLTPPYSIEVVKLLNGSAVLVSRFSTDYNILSSLGRLSLLFVGIFFIKQSAHAPSRGQRLRIQTLSLLLLIALAGSAATPIINVGVFQLNDLLLSFAFLLSANIAVISFLNKKNRAIYVVNEDGTDKDRQYN